MQTITRGWHIYKTCSFVTKNVLQGQLTCDGQCVVILAQAVGATHWCKKWWILTADYSSFISSRMISAEVLWSFSLTKCLSWTYWGWSLVVPSVHRFTMMDPTVLWGSFKALYVFLALAKINASPQFAHRSTEFLVFSWLFFLVLWIAGPCIHRCVRLSKSCPCVHVQFLTCENVLYFIFMHIADQKALVGWVVPTLSGYSLKC